MGPPMEHLNTDTTNFDANSSHEALHISLNPALIDIYPEIQIDNLFISVVANNIIYTCSFNE